MPTDEEIEDAIYGVSADARDLASFILKGTNLPRTLGVSNVEEGYLKQIQQWVQNGNIGGLTIDGEISARIVQVESELNLKVLQSMMKQAEKQQPGPKITSEPEQPARMMTSSYNRGKPAARQEAEQIQTPQQGATQSDVLDTSASDIKDLLDKRKAKIQQEIKGFRPGHDQRLFAINELLFQIDQTKAKPVTLDNLEKEVKQRLNDMNGEMAPENKKGKLKSANTEKLLEAFKEGTQSKSTSGNEVSKYQEMKDSLNERPTPKGNLKNS